MTCSIGWRAKQNVRGNRAQRIIFQETIGTPCITCKVENLHREGKRVYVGVFDMNQRLEKTRKVLREKQHLKKLIEEDILELERDVQDLEEILNQCQPTMQRS